MSRAATLSEQVVKQLVQHPRTLTVAGGVLGVARPVARHAERHVLDARGRSRSAAATGSQKRGRDSRREPVEPDAPPQPAAAAPRERELGWDDVSAGRSHRPRGRLPADPARRPQPIRPAARPHQGRAPQAVRGARLPDSSRAHPRQPGAQAECLSNRNARRAGRRRARFRRSATSRSIRAASPRRSSGIKTKDPAFGLDAYWIEPAAQGARAVARLHGRRREHGRRDSLERAA